MSQMTFSKSDLIRFTNKLHLRLRVLRRVMTGHRPLYSKILIMGVVAWRLHLVHVSLFEFGRTGLSKKSSLRWHFTARKFERGASRRAPRSPLVH